MSCRVLCEHLRLTAFQKQLLHYRRDYRQRKSGPDCGIGVQREVLTEHPTDLRFELSMKTYRRWFVPGGTYFFTLVTQDRRPFLCNDVPRIILGNVIRECLESRPFGTVAFVLLPEHLHAVWSLPPGDTAYSARLGWIKKEFTKRWLAEGGTEAPVSTQRQKRNRRGVWQPRFWEHTIRDESDLERHVDYVHYNPVKHGLATSPSEWQWSTFHRFVAAGTYDVNWGTSHAAIELQRHSRFGRRMKANGRVLCEHLRLT